jgi:amino acid transporter
MKDSNESFLTRLKNIFIGKPRDIYDKSLFKHISLIAFFAWIGLGSDGLSSSCYGPEEAFLALGKHTYLGIFVAIASALTIYIICASYNQIIHLFPTGGGGYLVASKLLSPTVGMISGCALLIDYVLTITISIASGADALFSILPSHLHEFKMPFAILCIASLTILNLRGIKESVVPLIPIFLVFVLTHLVAIVYAIISHLSNNIDTVTSSAISEINLAYSELGLYGIVFLILKAFSMGAGTFTGIEAVSNGIPILREPRVETAKKTMGYMAFSLAFTVVGLMLAYLIFNVHHVPGKTLNAVLFENMTYNWGQTGTVFVFITLISEACLLFIAAQTGFLDGPRILGNMAVDRWLPTRFSMLSDRLVTQKGILIMGIASLLMILISKDSVKFLVVLYSINVFITFVLSQLGMVRHWWVVRKAEKDWFKKIFINGIGFTVCSFILISVIIMKFHEGGWITILITGLLVLFAIYVKRHYLNTAKHLRNLEDILKNADEEIENALRQIKIKCAIPEHEAKKKTAVILVNGYNGAGVQALINTITLFEGTFINYVFVEVGVLDAGTFKGENEIHHLEDHVKSDLNQYVRLVERHGFHGEAIKLLGTDVIEVTISEAPKIIERYPNCIFFGGQLVFPDDSLITPYLHNYAALALQKKFYREGIPFVVLPIVLR